MAEMEREKGVLTSEYFMQYRPPPLSQYDGNGLFNYMGHPRFNLTASYLFYHALHLISRNLSVYLDSEVAMKVRIKSRQCSS